MYRHATMPPVPSAIGGWPSTPIVESARPRVPPDGGRALLIAAAVTPGIDARRRSNSAKNATCASGFPYLCLPSENFAVSACPRSIPSGTLSRFHKLRRSRPAPVSSITEAAICAVTSQPRSQAVLRGVARPAPIEALSPRRSGNQSEQDARSRRYHHREAEHPHVDG